MTPILVRVTINLAGMKAGTYVWVDPDDEWMEMALAKQWIVREEWLEADAPAAVAPTLPGDDRPAAESRP